MKNLTKAKAKKLSILKWEWIVSNNGSPSGLVEAIPELLILNSECGFCEFYKFPESECEECPIVIEEEVCCDDNHPFMFSESTENAKIMLDIVKRAGTKRQVIVLPKEKS